MTNQVSDLNSFSVIKNGIGKGKENNLGFRVGISAKLILKLRVKEYEYEYRVRKCFKGIVVELKVKIVLSVNIITICLIMFG